MAAHYNTGVWFQLRRTYRLRQRALFSLNDVLYWGLTDPALPEQEVEQYMSREARVRLQDFFNAPEFGSQVNDKSEFYVLCLQYGLPIPETYGVVRANGDSSQVRAFEGSPSVSLIDLPDGDYVAKPAWGGEGQGVKMFKLQGGSAWCDGNELAVNEVERLIVEAGSDRDMVVQRRLKPNRYLSKISGTEGIQCARVVSYLDGEGGVHVLFCLFKFLAAGNLVDNFGAGGKGNLISAVDAKNGQVLGSYTKDPSQLGMQRVNHHPDTGDSVNIALPGWELVLGLVSRAALYFPSLPLLGWDIALTENGPVILEANENWGVAPLSPYTRPPTEPNWQLALNTPERIND